MSPTSTKPVLAEVDSIASGIAAVWLAAGDADRRGRPLGPLVTRPTAVWNHPIAMAPYRAESLTAEDPR